MRESFYEESSVHQDESEKTKYKTFKTLSIIFYVLIGVWGYFVYTTLRTDTPLLQGLLIAFLPAGALFFIGFYFGKQKNKHCLDYDYTIVSGHIRISKIINGVKRVHIYNFDASSVDKIGKISNKSFKKYYDMPDVDIEFLTSNKTATEGKALYYIYANVKARKKALVVECSELFLVNLLQYTKRMIMEKDDV